MYLVTLSQQKLGEVGTVLAGDTRDQGLFLIRHVDSNSFEHNSKNSIG